MPAIGQLSVLAISLKPDGISVTLSPWLIQTFSMPWPIGRGVVLDAIQQRRVAARAHVGMAELALVLGWGHLAAQLHGHGEHAITDAQHRDAQFKHRLRGAQVVFLVGAGMAARQDDALEHAVCA
jgi:hypothetical protein